MPGIFVDTAGWGHIFDDSQPFHSLAATIYRKAREQGREIITTNYIIAELLALFSRPLRIPRSKAIKLIDGIKTSPYIKIAHVDSKLDNKAWQLLKNYHDKEWSIVDCASFSLMKQLDIFEALTTDHHFEQAGFARLLKT